MHINTGFKHSSKSLATCSEPCVHVSLLLPLSDPSAWTSMTGLTAAWRPVSVTRQQGRLWRLKPCHEMLHNLVNPLIGCNSEGLRNLVYFCCERILSTLRISIFANMNAAIIFHSRQSSLEVFRVRADNWLIPSCMWRISLLVCQDCHHDELQCKSLPLMPVNLSRSLLHVQYSYLENNAVRRSIIEGSTSQRKA